MRSFFRDRLEGVCFLILFPGWLFIASTAWAMGRLRGRSHSPQAFRRALRRWAGYVKRGFRVYRESWWTLWQLEPTCYWFHHLFWTEFFAARNLAGQPPRVAPERYLLIKLAHIGDAMHVGPMLQQLRAARPSAEIDVLVGPWCENLARRWSGVNQVFTYVPHYLLFHRGQTKGLRRGWAEIAFLRMLRKRQYTVVISTSTLNWPEWLLIEAARPLRWVGADAAISSAYGEVEALTEPYDSRAYESYRVAGLLRHLGIAPRNEPPFFPLTEDERTFAESKIESHPGPAAGPLVVLAPGAGWPGKIWPAERMGEVARHLREKTNARLVLIGSPSECDLADVVCRVAGNPILDLVGCTTIGQVAALIQRAHLFIGNDSGPLHCAASFDTPSLAMFGPTVVSKWAPRGPHHRVLHKEYDCEGCISWHPAATCRHDGVCMKRISVEEVLSQATALLQDAGRPLGSTI